MKQSNTHQKFSKMINSNVQKRKVLILMITLHSRWTYIWWSTNILKVHGIHSISVLWVNIVICIWSLIFFCLVMSENFRKTCLQYYKRDPRHYFTSPGLSWDAVFKMTDIKLEFKTDIDRLWERHVRWYHTFSTHM